MGDFANFYAMAASDLPAALRLGVEFQLISARAARQVRLPWSHCCPTSGANYQAEWGASERARLKAQVQCTKACAFFAHHPPGEPKAD